MAYKRRRRRNKRRNKSFLSKVLKFLFITSSIVFLLLLVLPILFKEQIILKVKEEANKNLNAKVDFGDFDLSLISTFPDLGLVLEDIQVEGVDTFANIKLAEIKSIQLELDLMSVLKGDQISINKVGIDQPNIHVIALKNGVVNYDIMIPDSVKVDDPTTEEDESAESASFQIALKEYFIRNANVIYDDRSSDMYLDLKGFTHKGKGDFTQDLFILKTNTSADQIDFNMEGVDFVKKTSLGLKADLDMNMKLMKFTFKENELQVNKLVVAFDGFIALLEDKYDMNVSFGLKESSFKDLLSLVPAVYAKDFNEIKINGTTSLKGRVFGVYSDDNMPGFNLSLKVNNGNVQYPDLPKALSDINVLLDVDRMEGPDLDNLIVNLKKLHLDLGGNPFDMNMYMDHIMSDPFIKGSLTTNFNLSTIPDIYPIEEELTGQITANLNLEGRASSLEQEKYEDFKANGTLGISKVHFSPKELNSPIDVDTVLATFNPKEIHLSKMEIRIGNSDIKSSGKLKNYLEYAMKGEVLKGNLSIQSQLIDVNELMNVSTSTDTVTSVNENVTEESTAIDSLTQDSPEFVLIPNNMDLTMNLNIRKLVYDSTAIEYIKGGLLIQNEELDMHNLSMRALGASLIMTGGYNTQNHQVPYASFTYDIKGLDLQRLANEISMVAELAPMTKNMYGKVYSKFNFKSDLDAEFNPIHNSITGGGNLRSNKIRLENFKPTELLKSTLGMDEKMDELKNVNISYEFIDGKVMLKPFSTKLGSIKTSIKGDAGFDQTLNFILQMDLPAKKLGGAAALLAGVTKDKLATLKTVPVKIMISGTFTDPIIKPIFAKTAKDIKSEVSKVVKEKVVEKVKEVKKEVKKKVDESYKKILVEADKQSKQIKAEARKQAKKLREDGAKRAEDARKEGYKQADDLADNGANFIEKKLNKKAAELLRKETDKKVERIKEEANKNADQFIQKADVIANSVLNNAKQRAEKIKNGI